MGLVSIFRKKEAKEISVVEQPKVSLDGTNNKDFEEQRLAVFERIAKDANGTVQTFQIVVNYVQTATERASPESKKRMMEIAVTARETLEKKLRMQDANADVNAVKGMLRQLDQSIQKLS